LPKVADSADRAPELPLEPTEDQPIPDEELLGNSPPTTPQADPDIPSLPPAPASPGNRGTPTPQQIEQLSRVLAAARAALEHDRFEEALTQLAGIQNLPMLVDDARRYQRLQLLVQYARNFREELTNAVAELQGGDEIPVGTSAVVGVVQTTPEQITVRVAGTNRTYHLDALPTDLAIAIVDLRLADSDPISLVVKAAYLVSRADARDDQLQKARDWFREAKEKGADIGDLEQVLDDTYPPSP
jgi:hypothetical protein